MKKLVNRLDLLHWELREQAPKTACVDKISDNRSELWLFWDLFGIRVRDILSTLINDEFPYVDFHMNMLYAVESTASLATRLLARVAMYECMHSLPVHRQYCRILSIQSVFNVWTIFAEPIKHWFMRNLILSQTCELDERNSEKLARFFSTNVGRSVTSGPEVLAHQTIHNLWIRIHEKTMKTFRSTAVGHSCPTHNLCNHGDWP